MKSKNVCLEETKNETSRAEVSRLVIAVAIFLIHSPFAYGADPLQPFIKIQSQVFDTTGAAANYEHVAVRMQVLTKNECLLRDEKHSEVSLKNGVLSLNLGEGSRSDASLPFNSMEESFNNSKSMQLFCYRGSPKKLSTAVETYTPALDEARVLKMEVEIPNKPKQTIMYSLSFNPFAVNAINSAKLEGIGAAGFLQVRGVKSLSQSNIEDFFGKVYGSNLGDASRGPGELLVELLQGNSPLYAKQNTPSPITSASITTALGYTPLKPSPELTDVAGIGKVATSGILSKTSAGSYSTLSASAPISISTASPGQLQLNVGAGLKVTSSQLVPDFGTGVGKVVEGNDSRLPATACSVGTVSRWTSAGWSCDPLPSVPAGVALTSQSLTQFTVPTTASQFAGIISDKTGTGSVVFANSPSISTPTFLTSVVAPMIIGGSLTNSPLVYKTTSAAGTIGADHIFKVGNNGSTEALRILNSGNVGIGTANPQAKLDVNGAVRFAMDATACSVANAGTQRYNSNSSIMEFCNGSSWAPYGVSGSGITSVSLSASPEFTVSGSPLASSGTLGLNWKSQSGNLILASPSGVSGLPSFRALTAADLPIVPINKGGTGFTTPSGAINALVPSQTGNQTKFLQTNGTSVTWTAFPTAVTNFTGSLSGDVSGTQSTTSVEKIRGRTVAATAPSSGSFMKWNNLLSQWEPTALASSSCSAAGSAMHYNMVIDTWSCDPITLVSSQVTGLGTAATKNTGAVSGNVPLIGGTGIAANKMCVSDGAGAITCQADPPNMNGSTMKLARSASAPTTCDASSDGAMAVTSIYTTCICKNGSGWVSTLDGRTACSWTGPWLTIAATAGNNSAMDITGVTTGISVNGSSVTFTLTNAGNGASGAISFAMTNTTNFSVSGGTCVSGSTTLAASGSCTIIIRPTSSQNGTLAGNLNIASANNPTIILLGTASGFSGVDPCSGTPSPGTVCLGGAIYLGSLSPGAISGGAAFDKYMTTPGGCGEIPAGQRTPGAANSPASDYTNADFTPTCSGTDSLAKTWNDGSGYMSDIAGLPDYLSEGGNYGGINTDQNYGSSNTTTIAAITTPAQGGYHAAARYCDRLNYGGYTDWYLPNRFELNLMHANFASIPGLVAGNYWSSTEYGQSNAWFERLNVSAGYQYYSWDPMASTYYYKTSALLVRCVRRY